MKEFDADGALLDIQLGDGPSGIELAQIFYEVYPHCALALLTRFPDPATAGISVKKLPPNCGFLRKDLISDSNYLLKALEDILTDHGSEYRADKDGLNPFGKLTFTQLEILKLVAEGLTNSAIATKRSTSESAVEQTLSAIMRGLDIKSDSRVNPRTEMARRYIQIAGVPERENEN
jgi:DNA-binding NarL/FixJ family response regulator